MILHHVKNGLGILDQENYFDNELVLIIGGAIGDLAVLGVDEFDNVTFSEESQFPEFVDPLVFGMVKSVLVLKVKMVFDPSASDTVNKALESQIARLEDRIRMLKENAV